MRALLFAVIVWPRAGTQLKCTGCCVPAPCDVQHRKPAERGLLSFLRLLRAFLLHVIKRDQTRPTPGQITDLAARPQHESGDPHPRLDAPPESLGGTMRFHRRGIYAHAAPHSLGSISRASTPLRALSTRKRPNRGKWTSKTNQACANCPRTTFTRGQ